MELRRPEGGRVWCYWAANLFQQPFDNTPVHPAAVGVNIGLSDKAEVSAVLGETESDICGEVELGEWFAADNGVIEGGEDRGVDANLGDDWGGGGDGIVIVGREETGGGRGVEFVEVIESTRRPASSGDGHGFVPL